MRSSPRSWTGPVLLCVLLFLSVVPLMAGTAIAEDVGGWEFVSPMPEGRSLFSLASDDEYLFIAGGFNETSGSEPMDTFFRYDPVGNVYDELPPMNNARAPKDMAYWNGSLWVFSHPSARNWETYSIANNIWTTIDVESWFNYADAECEVVNDTFYFFAHDVMKMLAYHPLKGTVTEITYLDPHHEDYATGYIDGSLFMFGGYNETLHQAVDTTMSYDIHDQRWYQWRPVPSPRYRCVGVVVNDLVYIIGGIDGEGNASAAVEAYCPYNDTWIEFPPMNQPRAFFRACYVDGSIYSFGGAPASRDEYYSSAERMTVPLPDLALGDLVTDVPLEGPVLDGSTVSVDVPVTNVGDWPARDVEVVLGVDDRALDRRTVPLLDVGGSSVVEFHWSPKEGEGTLWVSIDPEHSISEGSETDNDASFKLNVVPPKADLWVNGSSLVIDPPVFSDGDVVHIGIDVSNMGWVPATDVTWSFAVDGSEVTSGILAENLDPLDVHHQVIPWTVTRGNRFINISFAHPGEEIGVYSDYFSISIWVPARGDLAFSGTPSVEPSVVPIDGFINLTFEVVNQGETTVPTAVVHIVVEGTLEEAVGIGPLSPNATVTVSRSFNATSAGHGSISLIIDPDDVIREGNETNNIVDLEFEVVDRNGHPTNNPDGDSDWYWIVGVVLTVAVVLALYLVLRRTGGE